MDGIKARTGIIGCGTMGSQLALALQAKGVDVLVKVRSTANIDKYRAAIKQHCDNILWKRYLGKQFTPDEVDKIKFSPKIEDFKDVELIIETTSENYEVKYSVIEELNILNNPDLIVATNTSGLLISKLTSRYKYPNNFFGLHFFNPLSASKLVEITNPDNHSVEQLITIVKLLGKQYITIEEKAGLFVNRLLTPFWLDAVRELQQSSLTPHEIDNAIKLGCNHPVGALELLDMIGLDVFVDFCNNVYNETGDSRFLPPQLLNDKVAKGYFGSKTNQGFYKWENNQKVL